MKKILTIIIILGTLGGGIAYYKKVEKDNAPVATPLSTYSTNPEGQQVRSNLLDFNKDDYDQAFKSDKLIVLYFYANWCPICKAEFPLMVEAFNELNTDKVIGFRVNFNDNQTDENEEELAREYGVAYQHTKVFIRNGERIGKWPDGWDKNRYLLEINSRL